MKYILNRKSIFSVIFFALLFSVSAKAQPSWQWAKESIMEGLNNLLTETGPMAVDKNGNVYIAGYTRSPKISFGSYSIINTDTSDIADCIFLAKYDSLGNILWIKDAGPASDGEPMGLATDDAGNVYFTGIFSSPTVTFGTYTLSNSTVFSFFLVKYDNTGNPLWAKSGGSCINANLAVDHHGAVYITGTFMGSITIGTYAFSNTGTPSGDIFLAKFDGSGNVLWAKSAGGSGTEDAYGVTSDAVGNAYISGDFTSSSIIFDTYTLTDTNTSTPNLFLTKYDPSGNVLWAKEVNDPGPDNTQNAIIADASGNVYLTGSFINDSVAFDSHVIHNSTTSVSTDLYLVKYDPNGNVLWAKSGGGPGNDFGFDVAIDASGNIWLSGGFMSSSIILDTAHINSPVPGNDDCFLAKFDTNGHIIFATALASGGDDFLALGTDATGNIYVGGDFMSANPFKLGAFSLAQYGDENLFIGRLGIHPLGIPIISENLMKLYPNPVTGKLNITAPNTIYQVTITNLMGQELYAHAFNSDNVQIDLSELTAGLYFIKINGSEIQKFVKQ